jgi:hypothetical protein
MNISGRIGGFLKHIALSAGLGIVVLLILLTAIGFLIAALYGLVAAHFPAVEAAAITGVGLLLAAILIAIIGGAVIRKLRKPQPSLISEFAGTYGLAIRLVGMLVKRDPKKAIILAAVSGAIAEYVMGDNRKK